MRQVATSPLLENGGFFVGINNRHCHAEPVVSFPQAVLAGIMLAAFVAGVVCLAVGLS